MAKAAQNTPRLRLEDQGTWVEFLVPDNSIDPAAIVTDLSGALRCLLEEQSGSPSLQPIQVLVGHDETEWTFEVDPTSASRVRESVGAEHEFARIGVPYHIADDFRRMHGALYPHIVQWVTGLGRDQIRKLGGATFMHQGKPVWRFPPGAAPASGASMARRAK